MEILVPVVAMIILGLVAIRILAHAERVQQQSDTAYRTQALLVERMAEKLASRDPAVMETHSRERVTPANGRVAAVVPDIFDLGEGHMDETSTQYGVDRT